MLDLELIITRANAVTTAALRVELPSRRAELADEVPLALDAVALRALANGRGRIGASAGSANGKQRIVGTSEERAWVWQCGGQQYRLLHAWRAFVV